MSFHGTSLRKFDNKRLEGGGYLVAGDIRTSNVIGELKSVFDPSRVGVV